MPTDLAHTPPASQSDEGIPAVTSDAEPPPPVSRTWLPWLLVMALTCLVIALVTGILKALSGASLVESALSGIGTYLTSATLCVGAVAAVKLLRHPH